MRYDDLESFRRRLLGRRRTLLRLREHALEMERDLTAEVEPDWEDVATIHTALGTLETLRETERRGLQRIDDSLARMGRGAYGSCASCHEPIDEQRLRAVPDTDRCARCAPPR